MIEAKQLIKDENDSLKSKLQNIAFQKMAEAVSTSTFHLGSTRKELEHCLASYCGDKTTSSKGT